MNSREMLREIGQDASTSYDRVAQGYNDPSHETVRDFEVVTLAFFERTLFGHVEPGQRVLDLGGGRAYASRKLGELGSEVLLGDISREMLRCTKHDCVDIKQYCHLSAFELPFREEVFDVVLTLLCGAYLTEISVGEVFRVLRPGGIYLLTETPTEWAEASQSQRNMPSSKIWFKDSDGNTVLLPFSFIYTLDETAELVSGAGFNIETAETLRPGGIIPPERLSKVNRNVAKSLGVRPEEIPLLSAVIATKPPRSR